MLRGRTTVCLFALVDRAEPRRSLIFYGVGMSVCDDVQALWMDGLVSLGDVVSARERSELLEVIREKDVRLRTDTYEIILESIEEQQLL